MSPAVADPASMAPNPALGPNPGVVNGLNPYGVGGQYGDSPSEVNRTGPGTNPAIDPPSLASQPTDAVVGQGYNTPAELGPGPGVSIPGDCGTYDGAAGNPDDTPSEKNSFGPGVTGPGYDPGAVGEPNGDSPSEVNGRGPGTPAAAPSPVTAEPASDPPGAAPAAAEPGNAAVNAATVGPAADQSSPAPGNGNFGFGGGAPGSAFNDTTGSLTDPGDPGNPDSDRDGNQGGPGDGDAPLPFILDLSGQGIAITQLTSSNRFEVGEDNYQHRTAWAGSAVLFVDPNGDNAIRNADQYVFSDWDPSAAARPRR